MEKRGRPPSGEDNIVRRAVASAGGQEATAEMFGVTQGAVSFWCIQGRIPYHWRFHAGDIIERYPLFGAAIDRKPLDPRGR